MLVLKFIRRHLVWVIMAIGVVVVIGAGVSLFQREQRILADITESGGSIQETARGRVVVLSGRPLSRDLLRDVGTLQIRKLCLDRTGLSDAGLEHLKDCLQLSELDISSCQGVTDESVKYLKGMKGLTWLNVYGTKITPNGLAELRKEFPKCWINPNP